ncbi:MAG: hypothetical protein HP041_09930 [Oscillospiraceae bacterium]|nr:hypothetical protein [Oscillospiraceae bacterium]
MRTVCKAAVFLALSALLAMPALADETPGQKAVREAREATAAECEEVVFSLLSYSRYFDLDAMIGFPVHGFRQNNPATAYREAGSLDGALSDATVWKFQVEGNEVFTMQRGADGLWTTAGHAVDAQTFIDTDAVAAAIDGEDALRQAPSISLKFASSSYCQTYFALILADGREWVVPFGSHPDRTGLENGRLYTAAMAMRPLEIYQGAGSAPPIVTMPGCVSLLPYVLAGTGVLLAGILLVLLLHKKHARKKARR